jgi:CheY-like chemotaxis protein
MTMAGSDAADRIRVLLVEDDAEFAEMYRIRLEADAYDVAWARNGSEGLEKARSWMPSLIFLDMRMPEMSGLELLRELRAEPQTASIPVVVLTNYSDDTLQEESERFGILEWKLKMDTTPSGISSWIERWSGALAEEDAES